jgi:hypothetical protein
MHLKFSQGSLKIQGNWKEIQKDVKQADVTTCRQRERERERERETEAVMYKSISMSSVSVGKIQD